LRGECGAFFGAGVAHGEGGAQPGGGGGVPPLGDLAAAGRDVDAGGDGRLDQIDRPAEHLGLRKARRAGLRCGPGGQLSG
jgi:hypothetical protein